jgi:hypothetical protein
MQLESLWMLLTVFWSYKFERIDGQNKKCISSDKHEQNGRK